MVSGFGAPGDYPQGKHRVIFGPIAAWKKTSGLLSSTSSAFGTAFDV
jgi:hypothetical protein